MSNSPSMKSTNDSKGSPNNLVLSTVSDENQQENIQSFFSSNENQLNLTHNNYTPNNRDYIFGNKKRKRDEKECTGCNCKNSGCLKRYCECFARMKYCDMNCQCKNCINKVVFARERNEAVQNYLMKSPISFKRSNLDSNNCSCNCKKSNCLKNYCECYQLGLKCSYNCKCCECKNKNILEKKLFQIESYEKKESNEPIKNIILKKINNNKENKNKNHFNVTFIINKNKNENKIKKKFFSPGNYNDYFNLNNWNNLKLKRVLISNNQLIINDYNINKTRDINNNNIINNNNTVVLNNGYNLTQKNKISAFSAINF